MSDLDEAVELVMDLVAQDCTMSDGTLDSLAMSTYTDAIYWLAQHDKVEIVHEIGGRVIARWKTAP
jgi:hypothetical protein